MLVVGVRVSDDQMFVGPRWRDAFGSYLDRFFRCEPSFLCCPELWFGVGGQKGVALRLVQSRYVTYGVIDHVEPPDGIRLTSADDVLQIHTSLLRLMFYGTPFCIINRADATAVSTVSLWRHANGQELCTSAFGIPATFKSTRLHVV